MSQIIERVQAAKMTEPLVGEPAPPRLVAAMVRDLRRRVLLVEGAPGYERENLIRQALRSEGSRTAWVRVDEFDTRSGRLWRHVAAALDAPVPAGSATLDVLDAIIATQSAGAATWVVLERLDHALPDLSLGEVAYLASNLPATMHLIVTSERSIPGLSRRIGPSDLRRWTENELAWTDDEVREALTPHTPSADRESHPLLPELVDLVGGWPAAVRALQSQAIEGVHGQLAWLRARGADELLSGWWEGLPADHREFLLATQGLDVLCESLCSATCNRTDVAGPLSALVDTHGFLMPCDSEGEVAFVRRLPLLTIFLRRRPEDVETNRLRHRRAAAWFAQHYDSNFQIRHLIKAGDTEDALELIHALESPMFEAGRPNEVLAWYDLLPENLPGGQQEALLRRAWAVLGGGDPKAARPLHARLDGLVRAAGDQSTPRICAEVALLAAALAGSSGDARGLLQHATRAVAAFDEDWEGNGPQYATLLRVRGLLWTGRIDEARVQLEAVMPRLDASQYVIGLVAQQLAGAVALAAGHARQALAHGEVAVAFALREGLVGRSVEAAAAQLLRGSARIDLGDTDGAEQDLLVARETALSHGNTGHAVFASLGLARVEIARHAAPAALAWVAQSRQLLAAEFPHSLLRHHALVTEAQIRLFVGDTVRAKQVISSLPPSAEASVLAIRLGQLRRPGSGLARLTELTAHDRRTELSRQVLMAEALMPVSRRQVEAILLDVAETAQSEGLLMVLLGTSQELLAVGEEVAVRRGQDGLLQLVTLATPKAGDAAVGPRVVLSQGEVQILALLPGRDSNRQLAERLSISINTVKTRLRRLYAKLNVNSRDEAIRVARARGLLEERPHP